MDRKLDLLRLLQNPAYNTMDTTTIMTTCRPATSLTRSPSLLPNFITNLYSTFLIALSSDPDPDPDPAIPDII